MLHFLRNTKTLTFLLFPLSYKHILDICNLSQCVPFWKLETYSTVENQVWVFCVYFCIQCLLHHVKENKKGVDKIKCNIPCCSFFMLDKTAVEVKKMINEAYKNGLVGSSICYGWLGSKNVNLTWMINHATTDYLDMEVMTCCKT